MSNWDQSSGQKPRGAGGTLRPELVRAGDVGTIYGQTDRPLAIIVAGMHRSGTSALARALALCGASLPRTLIPANAFNEDGHWESELIAKGNDDLLAALGSAWDDALFLRKIRKARPPREAVDTIKAAIRDQFAPGHDVVIKDPRISLLYGPWRQALHDLGYDQRLIIAVRNPLEVAGSLTRRNGFPPVKSALLWLVHLLTLEQDSRGTQRAFVLYDDLLADWRGCLRRIEHHLGIQLPRWTDESESEIDQFLSSGRRHHHADINSLLARDDFPSWVAEAYRWAVAAASGDEELPAAVLNRIADEFGAAADIYAPLLAFERNRANDRVKTWADPVGPETSFEVSVYSATASSGFDETTRTYSAVQLVTAPRSFEIATPLRDEPITALRIDPASAPGTLVLHSLKARAPDGAVLWDWQGSLDVLLSGGGIVAERRGANSALLEFTDDDPQFRVPDDALGLASQVILEIIASVPPAEEVTQRRVARLGVDVRNLSLQVETGARETHTMVEAIVATQNAELAAIRNSTLTAVRSAELAAANSAEAATALDTAVDKLTRSQDAALHAAVADTQSMSDMRTRELSSFLRQQLDAIEGESAQRSRLIANAQDEAFARQREQIQTLRDEVAAISTGLQNLTQQTDQALSLAHSYGRTFDAMRASSSWRLTAPLRGLRAGPRAWFGAAKNFGRRVRNAVKRRIYGKSYAITVAHNPDGEALARLLTRSNMFDPDWYLSRNQDVRIAKIDPLYHFLYHGAFEGRAPGPAFDPQWYLAQNPDVAAVGINPLVHYLIAGRREKRTPLPRSEMPAHLGFGQHLRLLFTARHAKYLIASSGLAFDPILPRRFARRLRASAQANRPTVQHAPAQPTVSAAHTNAYDQLLSAASAKGDEYVPIASSAMKVEPRVKAIAFYLPQFHPIPENDAWWGRGFTEWTNVSKATPQFVGHYQPRLPDELGYYDLRVPDVQRRQVELAKLYGVHGFCFHYYWFTGRKRLLERPLNQFVAATDIDFPFCICWANENWTRRWDGLDQDILMEQRHEPQDDLEFIEDLAPLLRDPRYIRVDGRPLIIVYRVDILADANRTANAWREYCRANGIGEILLVAAQTFGIKDPRPFGFDAAVEFPPHADYTPEEVTREKTMLNPSNAGRVYDYAKVVKRETQFSFPDYQLFKSIIPSWDNEARKPGKGYAFADATPSLYRTWLTKLLRTTDEQYPNPAEKLVFINAWNEWAEGAYLEPDRRFGYGYLQATRDALSAFPDGDDARASNVGLPPLYVVIHAFHIDVLEEILSDLTLVRAPFRLIVTCPPDRAEQARKAVASSTLTCEVDVVETENRGRDVLAFMEAMRQLHLPPDAVILKLHTKKSTHREDGATWRREMLGELLAADTIDCALERFARDGDLSLIAPAKHLAPITTYIGFNQERIEALLQRGGWRGIDTQTDVFAAGTMFFIRRCSLDSLLTLNLTRDEFEQEDGQKDGTLAHALERMFGLVILREGGRIIDTNMLLNDAPMPSAADFAYAVKTDYLYRAGDGS
ncbi:MAG: glycoside hydrolase family 99-like domain-containing protein [Hyphomonadaceae bacterium]